jgi:hypothetical protein
MQSQLALHPNPFLMVGFFLFGLLANVAVLKIMAEVNSRLPEDQKFSYWWWTMSKHVRLWKEHRRLCPESHWRFYSVVSFAMVGVFMVLIVWSVHVPKPM